MKHTPAPWKIGHRVNLVVGPNGASIANCEFTHSNSKQATKPNPDECEANARLIVAAPELLSFAQQFLAEAEHANAEDDFDWQPGELMELARAAIAKAEGKSC